MENQNTEKEMKFCPQCNSIVETEIIYSYNIEEHYNGDFEGGGILINLSKCLRCKKPFLTKIDFSCVEERYWENSNIQLFPNTENDAIKNCPKIVINPYEEALKCYRAHAYDACVIMCRKGIEAICIDKGESKGNLLTKLKNLKEKGILEGTLFKWTDELRLIGNDGAHSHEQIVNQEDAKDALGFFDVSTRATTYFIS
ncbi:DUF4145 domain-containing protein [Myroides sp. M-43]|uniref:DUF4145 domain-containing protein n=1 Tax=Myroides oncorhynchi TaxID=2893756 RepID=UPI001E59B431|nr:DUF4145 domain-containing protein [Myroides oncorhynchi]MCC9043299.1 DUF4145 domain-containing protein [Myroides oncorhynchi]